MRVVADIREGTPIKKDTVARLTLQGITGLLYVNLLPRDAGSQALPPIASIKYPVIPSAQSQFDVLIASLPDVIAQGQ